MGLNSKAYLINGDYVSTMTILGMPREEWCVRVSLKETKEAIDSRSGYDRTLYKTIQTLYQDVFAKGNISYRESNYCNLDTEVRPHYQADREPPVIDVALIVTGNEGYQFLTCYSQPYITFAFYLSPYQTELWIVLGFTLATIIALATTVVHFLSREDRQHFSAWLFVLASLFEESGFMPSKIEKAAFFRICFGIWSIMSVILTNGYNGIMISDLNSPRRLAHPEYFDDLRCASPFDDAIKYLRLEAEKGGVKSN